MTVKAKPIADICACGCGRPIIAFAPDIAWPRLVPGKTPDYRPHNLIFAASYARIVLPPSVPIPTVLHYGNNL